MSTGATTVTGKRARPSTLRAVAGVIRDAWQWRQLIRAFTLYGIKHDKRNNILGNLWHLFNPVLNTLIFLFVVVVVFKRANKDEPYPLFFFSGSMFFRIWTVAISRGTSVLVQQAGLIKSAYFPRITVLVPLSLRSAYDFALESLVLIVIMLIYRTPPAWTIVLLPPFLLITFIGSFGTVLMISCLGARFRDLANVVQHVNRLLFYFTPVMYPVTFIAEKYRHLYKLNPITLAVDMPRDIIYRGIVPDPLLLAYYTVFCLAVFFVGMIVFARLQGRVTKYL